MGSHQQLTGPTEREVKNRVVSQVEKVENSPTKSSFMKLPTNGNPNNSNLKPVTQDNTDNLSNTNIKQISNPVTLPKPKGHPNLEEAGLDPNVNNEHYRANIPPQLEEHQQQFVPLNNKIDVGDSYLGFLRNKKSAIETSLNPNNTPQISAVSDQKLKKATNPSIASLRGISERSTPSGTISKGSSRAEFFAAKLHDAIKDDNKNNDDTNETFVYDTTTNGPVNNNEQELDFGSGPTGAKYVKDDTKSYTLPDSQSIITPSEMNTVNPGSPYYNKFHIDDTFDLMSKSSVNSRHISQRKMSKESGIEDGTSNQPMAKIEEQTNQLRQITSRLFDSKGVQPRRYSGIEHEISQRDSFDDDFDYYESNVLNQQANGGHNHKDGDLSNANMIYSVNENDSDFEDELSNYFRKSHPRNHPNNSTSPYNTTHNHNGISAYHQFNDYGSISNDMKPKLRKKRTDIYISPHDFTSLRTQRIRQVRNFCYTSIGIVSLLFTGFIFGFVLATNKELQSVDVIDVTDIIVSQEALIFDMVIDAFNPGLLPITIQDVQLDIFAKTMYVSDDSIKLDDTNKQEKSDNGKDKSPKKKYDTVLLGSIDKLEIPLSFDGGFLSRQHDISVTELKILNPCSFDDEDDDNNGDGERGGDDKDGDSNEMVVDMPIKVLQPNSKWLNISRNPFDMIVRGAMIYKLPLSNSNHTVSVSYQVNIKPNL